MMKNRNRGFTLVELLIVIAIILLVSAAVLPAVLPALAGRQINESARILQAALGGMRDAAIRANDNRGLRLMPDPILTNPAPSNATGTVLTPTVVSNAGTITLAYNRFVPIEPAGDYKEGRVSLSGYGGTSSMHPYPPFASPSMTAAWTYTAPAVGTNGSPPPYPWPSPGFAAATAVYPAYAAPSATGPPGTVLMIEQELFTGGPPKPTDAAPSVPNAPTSWYWNIRIGDKIRMSDAGRTYTVVGPMSLPNPELFVNVGPPGAPSPLVRSWTYANGTATVSPEFLFVVNGQDDNNDGIIDNGWNGVDDNLGTPSTLQSTATNPNGPSFSYANTIPNGSIDDLAEWAETEQFVGTVNGADDLEYTIDRRPVPTPGARDIPLPPNIVVDATSWNATLERSRLPIDPFTLNVDIMVTPGGTVVPSTVYSTPVIPNLSGLAGAFFHFWLSERQDVHELGEMWGATNNVPNPNPNAASGQTYMLPMPQGTPNYAPTNPNLVLKGDRRLVTLFTRSGLLTSGVMETYIDPGGSGHGFDGNNVNLPFVDAQLGLREAK